MSPVLSKKDGHFAKKCWITVLFFYVRVPSFHVVDGFKGGQISESAFNFRPVFQKVKSLSMNFSHEVGYSSDFVYFFKVGQK